MFQGERLADKSCTILRLFGILCYGAEKSPSRREPREGVLGWNPVSKREGQVVRWFQIGAARGSMTGHLSADLSREINS
jgi:hypothetical protein